MNLAESTRIMPSTLLTPAAIRLQIAGADRATVLSELVAALPELVENPEARRTLLHALEEREQLCSTGVGDGIAFPHSRNALVGLVEKPNLVFGRHPKGVDF